MSGRQGLAGDEEAVAEAVAEGFQEVVEGVARDTEKLGRVRGKLPGVKGVSFMGRGAQEPSCSRRSTGAPRRRGLGRSRAPELCWFAGVAREVLVAAAKLSEGCWSEGGAINRPAMVSRFGSAGDSPWRARGCKEGMGSKPRSQDVVLDCQNHLQ